MELQSTALPTELRKGVLLIYGTMNTTRQRGLPEVRPVKVPHPVGSINVYSLDWSFRLGWCNTDAPMNTWVALILGHRPFPPPQTAPKKIRTSVGGFKDHSANQLHHRSGGHSTKLHVGSGYIIFRSFLFKPIY